MYKLTTGDLHDNIFLESGIGHSGDVGGEISSMPPEKLIQRVVLHL